MLGVAVIVVGVVIVSVAGFGRDKALKVSEKKSGGFLGGLIMCVISGVLSAGIALSFVYGQGPVVEVMKVRGAGNLTATLSVMVCRPFQRNACEPALSGFCNDTRKIMGTSFLAAAEIFSLLL